MHTWHNLKALRHPCCVNLLLVDRGQHYKPLCQDNKTYFSVRIITSTSTWPPVWTWIYWTCRQSTVVVVAANVKQLNTDKCSSGPSRPWYRMCHLISQMFDLFLWASCVLYHYVSHHLYHNRSHYLVVFNTGMRSQLYLGHLHRRHAFTVCVPSYNYEPWTICVNSGQRREAPAPAVGWDVISCPSSGDRQRIICLKFSNSFSLLILNIRR